MGNYNLEITTIIDGRMKVSLSANNDLTNRTK